ncbi:TetR/AcrR family transcriptional regulator [Streptomyces sp. KL118A]|uniref:TetR/AcrR family transcriptional regulator n=1 Tax=Streptomyces sp. KL118A TaxID=3045153 RepID=UPI00278C3A89|nr:TetR/AcrR family transcriptional regulator [Streptomyces sp. KL118A]
MPAQPSHKPSGQVGDAPVDADPAGLRADARRNRERILEAAREVFAAQGIDAPMSAVARRAEVGVATLYRRFPTRTALATAAFAEQLDVCAAAFDEALADPDPGRGLYALLEKVCATQVTDRGFATVFRDQFPDALDHDQERECAEEGLARLVRRAREAGQLRADFDPSDITLLLLAAGGLAGQPREVALAASRRMLAYFFQAFQVERPGSLPPPAVMELRDIRRPPGHP